MDVVVRFLNSPFLWVIAAASIASLFQTFLFVRDRMAELLRRRREPEVEAEVRQRIRTAEVPVARPATRDTRVPNYQEWLSSDPEPYPSNRIRSVAVIFLAFVVICVVAVLCAWDWKEGILLGIAPVTVGGIIWVALHKPSHVWRVRREVRIASVAREHGAEYVATDFPGQGWDMAGVRGWVDQVSRDWDARPQGARPIPEGSVDGALAGADPPAVARGTATVLEAKPVEAIRSASHPCFEYGMEKLKTSVFRFYVVAEAVSVPYVAIKRHLKIPARQQRHAMDGSLVDQSYAVAPGCEAAFSRLSRRTRELMIGVHVDKMVLDRGWAVLWWDGRVFGGIDFGKDQNWDGRMDMASEKTWDGVEKVRALLASIENDLAG